MMHNDKQWQDEDDRNDEDDGVIAFVDLPDSDLQPLNAQILRYGRRLRSFTQQPRFALLPSLLSIPLLLVLLSGSQLYQRVVPASTMATLAGNIFSVGSIQITIMKGTTQQSGFIIMSSGTPRVGSGPLSSATRAIVGCATGTGTNIGAVHSVGSYPVWIKGILGSYAHIPLTPATYQAKPWAGWNITLQVAMIYNFNHPVTLSVFSPPDGLPAAFATSAPNVYTTTLTLDEQPPDQRKVPDGDKFRNIWDVTLHIPQNGCYKLQADWMTGTWSIFFTASPA